LRYWSEDIRTSKNQLTEKMVAVRGSNSQLACNRLGQLRAIQGQGAGLRSRCGKVGQ
jgi:hypothetical protein